jgi:hypothetical protein
LAADQSDQAALALNRLLHCLELAGFDLLSVLGCSQREIPVRVKKKREICRRRRATLRFLAAR